MKALAKKIPVFLFLLLLLTITLDSCQKEETAPLVTYNRGDVSLVNSIKMYTPQEIQQILDVTGADLPFEIKHNVEAVSIQEFLIN